MDVPAAPRDTLGRAGGGAGGGDSRENDALLLGPLPIAEGAAPLASVPSEFHGRGFPHVRRGCPHRSGGFAARGPPHASGVGRGAPANSSAKLCFAVRRLRG